MQEVQAGFSLERLATGAVANSGPVTARFFYHFTFVIVNLEGI
jgi:hypothetical protein